MDEKVMRPIPQMEKISIAIPAYEMKGFGVGYLEELFQTIYEQTYFNIEVVVSDHDNGYDILNACEAWKEKLPIVYVRNFYDRGNGPANTNCAIGYCTGDRIKIMFQDDLFTDKESLSKIAAVDAPWVVTGFTHTQDGKTFERDMVPRWSEHLLEGQNFMGGPSVVTMKRECMQFFDPNCRLLMDTEFYHRMRYYNGMPTIVPDIMVANREGAHRVSMNLDLDSVCEHPEGNWEVNQKELDYVVEKHKETREYAS